MHEIRDLNRTTRNGLDEGVTIVESDNAHPNDRISPKNTGTKNIGTNGRENNRRGRKR